MKKNLYLYICIGVLFVFTIVYFVVANNMSYAFVNNDEEITYNHVIVEIKNASANFISSHEDLFNEEDIVYIIVDDLVNEGLLEADSDGKVKDPSSPVKTFNNVKIRLTKLENGYDIKVLA